MNDSHQSSAWPRSPGVRWVTGDLEAHTRSGSLSVTGAARNLRLETGSGTVGWPGAPAGECRFETGTGRIVLRPPADLDPRIQAETGIDSVDVQFAVKGRISRQEVEGVAATGQEAALVVSTGSGWQSLAGLRRA